MRLQGLASGLTLVVFLLQGMRLFGGIHPARNGRGDRGGGAGEVSRLLCPALAGS